MKRTEVIIFGIHGRLGSAISLCSGDDFTVAAGVSNSVSVKSEVSVCGRLVPVYPAGAVPPEFAKNRTVVDASSPSGTETAVAISAKAQSPLIVATTGHDARQQSEIKVASECIPIVMDSNFSRGMAMVRNLLPSMFPAPDGFDISILERHRALKKDSPSGTAMQLARGISSICGGMRIKTEAGPRIHGDMEIVSIRAGSAAGSEHRIFLHDSFEELELRHTVTDSRAYADGIVHAAKWLNERERMPGLYSMRDTITLNSAVQE